VEADAPLSSFRIGWKAKSSRYKSIDDQQPREHPSPAAIITSSIRVVAIKPSWFFFNRFRIAEVKP
jgi:hypothetical protein